MRGAAAGRRQRMERAIAGARDGTLTARLLEALKGEGARAVFGIPGDYALSLFEEIEHSAVLPLYTMSHEPGLAFAADAAARAAGGFGVAAVTYGAGALNLVNGVAAAYAERSPLAVISAAPARRSAWPSLMLHHQVRTQDSQLRIFREVTCAQAVLDDPSSAPGEIARVLAEGRRRSLPVYFEIPSDLAAAPCGPVTRAAPAPADPDAVAECAGEILRLARAAKRPVAMIGVEVRRFGLEAEVAALVRRAGIAVVTSFMGRNVAAEQGIEVAGSYLGLAGDPAVTKLVEDSDALILFGVILCDTNLGLPAERLDLRRVVHAFDGAVRIGHHTYPGVDLKSLVHALDAAMPAGAAPQSRGHAHKPGADFVADAAKLVPADIAAALNRQFARVAALPVVCDVGDSLFISLELACTKLAAQGYYASMGFAVPAAFGVQAATGERPLVLVGDGAFQMTGWELGNCRRYGFDPIVVVLNNTSWGMLELFAPCAKFNALSDWHFADIATSLGGDGARVSTRAELAAALDAAWQKRGRFQLIEAMLAPGEVSPQLQRFVGALAARKAASQG